jgi:hypothetical protein
MAPETDFPVVAVLSGVMWELGVTDALYFSGQISVYNKQQVQDAGLQGPVQGRRHLRTSSTSTSTTRSRRSTSSACSPPTTRRSTGILEKRGGDLNIDVADDASTEVQSPENYAFQIGVKPQPAAQTITVATSFTVKIVKAWGLKVG